MDSAMLVFMLLLLGVPSHDGLVQKRLLEFNRLTKQHRLSRLRGESGLGDVGDTSMLYITQNLDHFDAEDDRTFEQRYFVRTDLWSKSDGPVFLYIGGEGELSSFELEASHMKELAVKYKALMFAVEHRFYGLSVPPLGTPIDLLKLLSSHQALADLTQFYENMTEAYGLQGRKWICFGGSYPGSLSAWFRIKFPHIVAGSVASSAPVQAVVDFTGYNDVVRASLSDPIVGGSLVCAEAVREAFKYVDELIYTHQLVKLSADFLSCKNLTTDNDIVLFVSNLAGIFMGVVQYNKQIGTFNIQQVCEVMVEGSQPTYNRLVTINKMYLSSSALQCSDNDAAVYEQQLGRVERDSTGKTADRQWFFQTCSQFGYYQTCEEGTECLFSRYMTLTSQTYLCKNLFGIEDPSIVKDVAFSNAFYGGRTPSGSRIVFVNGSIDPWHQLSILSVPPGGEIDALLINGTSHCQDLYASSSSDLPQLIAVRQVIAERVGRWLTA